MEYSFLPLFNSYKGGEETSKSASASGLDAVRKNLAQLKVHLVQCKQNLDIPEIELYFEPECPHEVLVSRSRVADFLKWVDGVV